MLTNTGAQTDPGALMPPARATPRHSSGRRRRGPASALRSTAVTTAPSRWKATSSRLSSLEPSSITVGAFGGDYTGTAGVSVCSVTNSPFVSRWTAVASLPDHRAGDPCMLSRDRRSVGVNASLLVVLVAAVLLSGLPCRYSAPPRATDRPRGTGTRTTAQSPLDGCLDKTSYWEF